METIQTEVVVLEKVEPMTTIHTIRGKKYQRAIYKLGDQYFVRGHMSYEYYRFNNLVYSEVTRIDIGNGDQWYL